MYGCLSVDYKISISEKYAVQDLEDNLDVGGFSCHDEVLGVSLV